jgi:hypothetical protein
MCYEDSTRFLGMTDGTLPSLAAKVATMSGAGIAGELEAVSRGHFDAMTLGLNFRTNTSDAISLTEPRRHQIELRGNQQIENPTTGIIEDVLEKHVFVVMPKSYNFGSMKPNSTEDVSGEYAVRYWACYIGGKKVLEIDPINYVCSINGVDYLADERNNLGI